MWQGRARQRGERGGWRAPSPREVAHDLLQLAVPLRQGLVQVLDMLGRIGQAPRALPQIAAQHADLVGRSERPREEPEGVQPLDPLAILHSAFGAPLQLLHWWRIDEENLKAARRQEGTQGDPIDAGRFEGSRGDATRQEPGGQGVQVCRRGAEAAYGLGLIPGRDRHAMGFGPDVDPRRVSGGSGQLGGERGRGWRRFRRALGHGGLHNASESSKVAGAGAARLQHSATRDQGDPGTRGVAAGSRDQPHIRAQSINALSVSTSRYHGRG